MAPKNGKSGKRGTTDTAEEIVRMPRKIYEKELFRLQAELVKLQEWVRTRVPGWWWSSRAGTRRAREALSSGSPSTSTRAFPGSPPCRR